MSTISDQQAGARRRRRNHSDEFKADAVAACMQPGVSMAATAMARGINANILRRWVREMEMKVASDGGAVREVAISEHKPSFIPVSLPTAAVPAQPADIRIELQLLSSANRASQFPRTLQAEHVVSR